ncbi:MAG: glycosyltransferase [Acidobacteriota bacterium]|jgi:GT2 family glycosyltransferase|nr:glycosyltransferase [Acidobacteriota bacterium]
MTAPALTVVIPTFNNVDVLRTCVGAWREYGGAGVELVVVEDGCTDGTRAFLEDVSRTSWGANQLRWIHEDDGHELRCTNAGMTAARGGLVMAWQDDMFLRADWLVPELVRTFGAYPDIGLVSLSRGLDCVPLDEPIDTWEQLVDWRRLPSTIGPAPGNWWRLQEVDIVIRPWILRRACLERVGLLDEAFRPTEWDEADLACRIREAGWRVATSGFERLGAYAHLGSTTLSRTPSAAHQAGVLQNGRLFHARWDRAIETGHRRARMTWRRRATAGGWSATAGAMIRAGVRRVTGDPRR